MQLSLVYNLLFIFTREIFVNMSRCPNNTRSCCCSQHPDLLQRICPNRKWEVDHFKSNKKHCCDTYEGLKEPSDRRRSGCCKCTAEGKKAKGKFGVAWICESPNCSCCEPFGWQVEFTDTPSKVEERCRELIEWVNKPPLPKEEQQRSRSKCRQPNRKSHDSQTKKNCFCSELKKVIHRCPCDNDTFHQHCCDFGSDSDADEDICVCKRKSSCSSCECDCSSTNLDDEIPERDTQRGEPYDACWFTWNQIPEETCVCDSSTTPYEKDDIGVAPCGPPKQSDGFEVDAAAQTVDKTETETKETAVTEAPPTASDTSKTEPLKPLDEPVKDELATTEGSGRNETKACHRDNCPSLQVRKERGREGSDDARRASRIRCKTDPPKCKPVRRCNSADCPTNRNRRRVWLPAEVTTAILKKLKFYVNGS